MEGDAEKILVENSNSSTIQNHFQTRYTWLDKLRGVVLIFLFISKLTWIFSAQIRMGEIPIGPTWLNFGFKYVDFYPRMITLIDLGSEIFMFIMGISLAISFHKKLKSIGVRLTWASVFNRVFVFFWLSEVMLTDFLTWELNDIILIANWAVITGIYLFFRFRKFKLSNQKIYITLAWSLGSCLIWFFKFDSDIWNIFFNQELALLGWGTLIGALFLWIFKKPDLRFTIPIILFIVHYYLWAEYRVFSLIIFKASSFEFVFIIPFKLIGITIAAIIGTCIWDWMQIDPQDQRIGIRKRFVPVMVLSCIGHFIVDFFQTADSDGMNVSLTLLAIAFSSVLTMCIYGIDMYIKYDARFLNSIGSNGLFLFLLQAILTIPYRILWSGGGDQFREMTSGWFGLTKTHTLVNLLGLFSFLLPIALLVGAALILNKYKIRIKV